MIKKLIVFILLIPSICIGDPAPSSAVVVGNELTIQGASFLTNDVSKIEYLGDSIEEGTPDTIFSKTNWTVYGDTSTNVAVRYSTTQAHSGNNSLLSAFYGVEGVGYDSFFMFDTQSTDKTEERYVTAWIYFDKQDASTVMQWKNWWFNSVTSISSTSVMQCAAFWRDDGVGDRWDSAPFRRLSRDHANVLPFSPAVDAYNPKPQWKRIEIFVKPSSSDGVADGGLSWYRIDEPTMARSKFDFITHGVTDTVWRYIQLGLFYGSLTPSETIRDCKVYHDDIYISNSRARIEVSKFATWIEAIDREILKPLTWDGFTITGEYTTTLIGDTYIYVVDSNGDVNENGVLITADITTVVLQADFSSISPTTYTGTASAITGRTITGVVSSNGFTVTPDDGVWDEQVEAFTVSGVTVPVTDTCTATDSESDTGFDSITITLPTPPSSSGTIGGATVNANFR